MENYIGYLKYTWAALCAGGIITAKRLLYWLFKIYHNGALRLWYNQQPAKGLAGCFEQMLKFAGKFLYSLTAVLWGERAALHIAFFDKLRYTLK